MNALKAPLQQAPHTRTLIHTLSRLPGRLTSLSASRAGR